MNLSDKPIGKPMAGDRALRETFWKIVMDILDFIVAVVVLTPFIYGAIWYYRRGKFTSEVADQTVRDLVGAVSWPQKIVEVHEAYLCTTAALSTV